MSSTTRHRPPRAGSIAARLGQSRVANRLEGEVRVTAADLVDCVAEAKLKVAAVRYKVEGEVRNKAEKLKNRVSEAKSKLGDEARFIKSWIDDPLRTGSVTPSSPALARRMASYVEIGQAEGAEVMIGGGRPAAHGEGFFFEIVERRGYKGYGAPNAIFRIAAQKRHIRPMGMPRG